MDDETILNARIEVMRMVVDNCTQRDILNPIPIADKVWDWVYRGSGKLCSCRPEDNRKDDSSTAAQKPRRVRKGSTSQSV
jgi:hypothetical protein|tara:strand:+ start:23 stop:262 length:240 start_codon:yes stop_codon:yes gene_type:complete